MFLKDKKFNSVKDFEKYYEEKKKSLKILNKDLDKNNLIKTKCKLHLQWFNIAEIEEIVLAWHENYVEVFCSKLDIHNLLDGLRDKHEKHIQICSITHKKCIYSTREDWNVNCK